MTKQNNKLTEVSQSQDKGKKSLIVGGLLVIIIASTPILFYTYESFPNSTVWETYFFTLETNFPSWINFAYYLIGKSIPLLLLLIWFFTCKHWWHWIILVPIAMYSFQIWGVLNESNGMDEVELIYVIPLMMVLVPFVYLIRAKLFSKVRGNDLAAFEAELGQNRTLWQQIIDLFR
ncbi:hypothetical protein ULMA_26340 [Patiriisocius marinus]|uniref:Uncharacterized protein n=1 Tax=Patiriisocius marinus TaxID=1397112 RepID=A0A5J4IZW6_9FLAO|nr:hypothetical protein ULMA_26340 [Patiriisocius marinus]